MAGLSNHRVLVVEDEYYLAHDVARSLERAGATVVGPFPDESSALEALEERKPHCAVLDVNLGDGAGFALADRLRGRGVPFLFFTGYDRDVIPERFADVPRLEKPVDDLRLVRAIEEVCAKSGCA